MQRIFLDDSDEASETGEVTSGVGDGDNLVFTLMIYRDKGGRAISGVFRGTLILMMRRPVEGEVDADERDSGVTALEL